MPAGNRLEGEGRGVIAMEGRAVGPLTCVPSNDLSSAMDLNFDRFFQTIFSQGCKLSTQRENVNSCY